jgi:predicted amidophosphoribosyltransferase
VSKRKKSARAFCRGCGSGLKRKDALCPSCGRVRGTAGPGSEKVFTSGGVLYKAAGANVVPIGSALRKAARQSNGRPRCWNQCPPGRPGQRYCAGCGERYGITWPQHCDGLVKAARVQPVAGVDFYTAPSGEAGVVWRTNQDQTGAGARGWVTKAARGSFGDGRWPA